MITKNTSNVNILFRLFVEFAKYSNEKLTIQDFFKMFLNCDIYLYKQLAFATNEANILNTLFSYCQNIYWDNTNYCLTDLSNGKIYTDFVIKKFRMKYLYDIQWTDKGKVFIENFATLDNYFSLCSKHNCFFAKINEENSFFLFYTDITQDEKLIEYFTKQSFLIENYYQMINNLMIDSFMETSNYFIQLPKKIVDNNYSKGILKLRFSGYYNNTLRKFIVGIHVENFEDLNLERIKDRIPKYSIHFNAVSKDEFYKIVELMNNCLLSTNCEHNISLNVTLDNFYVIDYHVKLSYTYSDILNFIRYVLLTSHIVYL